MNKDMPGMIIVKAKKAWEIFHLAAKKFSRIDGAQRAGAFSYYAFFSMFPLIILFVIIVSVFISRDKAGLEVIGYAENYIPLSVEVKRQVMRTVAGVIKARGQAGIISFFLLIFGSIQFIAALIRATNRAWNTEVHNWWRSPIKSLGLLGILACAVLLGIAVSITFRLTKAWLFPVHSIFSHIFGVGSFILPLVIVFLGISLFYKLAPRRKTSFSEVWAGAVFATLSLRAAESLFVVYIKKFTAFNLIYGTFGGIMGLLLSIYLSGYIIIFGACLCASRAEILEPHKTRIPLHSL